MTDNVYLKTIDGLEPDIAMVDRDAALDSIAISLKRIADCLDSLDPGHSGNIRQCLWEIAQNMDELKKKLEMLESLVLKYLPV